MKRTYRFVQPSGTVLCWMPGVGDVTLPVVQGIFKHAAPEALFELLKDPKIAQKYTLEALRVPPWPVLKHFPRQWLKTCLASADLPAGRRRALEFMLS
ncbi:MAG TPA: hypothetical protein VFJ58_10045 [Armatimonadota bacterium]|nr:hypothetical protein [Armatimonadota bacterium]